LRAVEDSRRDAVVHGVRAVPALVIGDEWLLTGVREIHEYRECSCAGCSGAAGASRRESCTEMRARVSLAAVRKRWLNQAGGRLVQEDDKF